MLLQMVNTDFKQIDTSTESVCRELVTGSGNLEEDRRVHEGRFAYVWPLGVSFPHLSVCHPIMAMISQIPNQALVYFG